MKKRWMALLLNGLMVSTMSFADALTPDADVKRADAAQAIINYQAQLAEIEREKALMQAPGTSSVMATGQNIQQYLESASSYSTLLNSLTTASQNAQLLPPAMDPRLVYFQKYAAQTQNLDVGSLVGQTSLATQDAQKTAQQVIMNLTNPFPSRMSPQLKAQLNANATAQSLDPTAPLKLELPQQMEYADRQMTQATFSVAQHSLREMMTVRMPTQGADASSPGPSLLETMEQEASWRLTSPDWITNLATTPKEGVLRELAQMQAVHLWIQYQQYRQAERIEALLATQLSNQAQLSSYLSKMFEQVDQLQAQAGK